MSGVDPAVEIARAVAALSNADAAHPAVGFPHGHTDVDCAGLYSWWADGEARALLAARFDVPFPELIYAGQAGATSSRSGVERSATLRSRITGNPLRGSVGSSTFRKILTAVLAGPLALTIEPSGRPTPAGNAMVSAWMQDHLRITTYAVHDRTRLAALEQAVLHELDPPLNLMGMPPTAIRNRLKELRRELR